MKRLRRLETIRNAKIDGEGLNWEKTFDFTGVTDQFQQVADQFSVQTDAMNTDYSEFVIQTKTSTESIKTDVLASIETVDTALKTFITQTTNNFRTMAKQSNAQIQSIISALNAIPRNITTVHTIVTRSVSGGSGKHKGICFRRIPQIQGNCFLARGSWPLSWWDKSGSALQLPTTRRLWKASVTVWPTQMQSKTLFLQEQNELLRAILNKSGVYLDGKQLKKSVDKASRSSGANILVGVSCNALNGNGSRDGTPRTVNIQCHNQHSGGQRKKREGLCHRKCHPQWNCKGGTELEFYICSGLGECDVSI